MRILFLTAEMAPYTKVGGLGDVAGSLPSALRESSSRADVRVMTPLHGNARRKVQGRLEKVATVEVPHPEGPISADVLATEHRGTPVYFITNDLIDESGPVYHADAGYDAHRFCFFSLAGLAAAKALGFQPDVVHAQDWHTSPAIAAVHRARFEAPNRPRTVLTVHNLPFVGYGAAPAMHAFGLVPGEQRWVPDHLRDLPLPVGLSLADRITTVSPGYAREMMSSEHGAGLEGLIRARRESVLGVLNGLDLESWDPATDPALTQNFDVANLDSRLINKVELCRALDLPIDDRPLLAVVSRLTPQKGIDLVPEALRRLADRYSFSAVLLGTGDRWLEEELERLAREVPGRVAVRIGFDDALSRRIYGSADHLMIPSRYEPCGLVQMIAMRYGCIPVARDTGGLSDTVHDLDLDLTPTGILFAEASSASMTFALRRAIATYGHAFRHRKLQKNGMQTDFSWTRAASTYLNVYEDLVSGDLK